MMSPKILAFSVHQRQIKITEKEFGGNRKVAFNHQPTDGRLCSPHSPHHPPPASMRNRGIYRYGLAVGLVMRSKRVRILYSSSSNVLETVIGLHQVAWQLGPLSFLNCTVAPFLLHKGKGEAPRGVCAC